MQDNSTNVNGERPISWTGTEIFLSVFLAWLFCPAAAFAILKGLGVENWYYGDDTPETARRLGLWVGTLAAPFQVLTYPLVLSAFRRTTWDQLGLTTRRFGRNVLAGIAVLPLLAPVVFGLWQLIRWLYGVPGEKIIEQHDLEKIAPYLYPFEWVMLFFTAIIGAPVHEELTFRGVLQPWFASRRWGGHAAMLGALLLALSFRSERLRDAWPEGMASLTEAAAPALFVLALVPLYIVVWLASRTPIAPAIFGTSLLFACIHSSVWPTPIPLFVLALGLGALAHSTRSLVGPIVMHGLFNGFSCVLLLWETKH
ncbi:MAG TPA: CPBP family intramembrane glutamic endopeptidase [Gemmataceae bacterium]|nr:CPBP family intramembrane glutamic endopeptidase [Gemmataceae bacterium]